MKRFIIMLCLTRLCVPSPARAAIHLPAGAPTCVRWAAGDVTSALQDAGVPLNAARVQLSFPHHSDLGPEAFDLAVRKGTVRITGGDSVGAMYGLQELAEQIRNSGARGSWPAIAGRLTSTRQQPVVRFRGDNMFIHDPPLLLQDVPMWKSYIDMLARDRFNVLDLHGGYDLQSTGFPNLYPLLVHVPEYPQVGNQADQARNLDDFKTIVAYAKDRGVHVAFMNYSAGVHGVPKEKLADYTAKAVAALLKAIPDLYRLGFRVGESGQPASFYQDSYIKGVDDSGNKHVQIYTRSWVTTRDQLAAIGRARNGQFDIEIKYNGEQLGLPYQALEGGYGSYSYQDYIQPHSPYHIIWQVRANGTHRFWAWEDTTFIRRTVKTFRFGSALGFTLEPYVAYFPTDAAAYYRSPGDQATYKYIFQKNWMWHFAWGRMAYNPALPDTTIMAAYREHYGRAGATIYQAMQACGPIVPLALSYRFQGPDQRNMSPETETGCFYRTSHDKSPEILDFARNTPMDARSFMGIDNLVQEKIDGKIDGRIGPEAVARIFSNAAADTRRIVDSVGPLTGRAADEWRLLKTDLLSASFLGDYYAARIRGSLELDYALQTGSQTDYDKATALLADSRRTWARLAATADAVYAPLNNNLRHQSDYQWGSQVAPLEKLDATAADLWQKRGPDPAAKPLELTPAESGGDTGIRVTDLTAALIGGGVTIHCRAAAPAGIETVILWSKPLPSEDKWAALPMNADSDGEFSLTVPLPPEGLMYQVEAHDGAGHGIVYPNTLNETPYRVVGVRF